MNSFSDKFIWAYVDETLFLQILVQNDIRVITKHDFQMMLSFNAPTLKKGFEFYSPFNDFKLFDYDVFMTRCLHYVTSYFKHCI